MFVFIIKNIRKNKNISLKELSDRTKISKSYLSDIENNKKFNISLDKLYKISKALDINIKDLFYTNLELEKLKRDLYKKINKYGINSKEVLELSKIIDLLINLKMKELD